MHDTVLELSPSTIYVTNQNFCCLCALFSQLKLGIHKAIITLLLSSLLAFPQKQFTFSMQCNQLKISDVHIQVMVATSEVLYMYVHNLFSLKTV